MVYLDVPQVSPNFLTECFQQPQLATLLNGCLDSTMVDSKKAIGLMLKVH